MDVIKLAKRRTILARIISAELWLISTHWNQQMKRTLLCPGTANCMLCATERPKARGYAIALVKQATGDPLDGLIELTNETLTQLLQRGLDSTNAAGFTWRMERRESRPGWRILGTAQDATVIPVDPETLPAAIEKLYGLPPTMRTRSGSLQQVFLTQAAEWLDEQRHVIERRIEAAVAHTQQNGRQK